MFPVVRPLRLYVFDFHDSILFWLPSPTAPPPFVDDSFSLSTHSLDIIIHLIVHSHDINCNPFAKHLLLPMSPCATGAPHSAKMLLSPFSRASLSLFSGWVGGLTLPSHSTAKTVSHFSLTTLAHAPDLLRQRALHILHHFWRPTLATLFNLLLP